MEIFSKLCCHHLGNWKPVEVIICETLRAHCTCVFSVFPFFLMDKIPPFARLREESETQQESLKPQQRYSPALREKTAITGELGIHTRAVSVPHTAHLLLLLRSPPPAIVIREQPRRPGCRGPPGAARGVAPCPALPQAPRAPLRANYAPFALLPTSGKAAPEGEAADLERMAEVWRGRGQERARSPPPGTTARTPAPPGRAPTTPRGRERSGLKSDSDLRAPHRARSRSQHRAVALASAP